MQRAHRGVVLFTFVYSRMIGRDVSDEGLGSTHAANENSPLKTSAAM